MNSFRDTPGFYTEEIGNPITRRSFLQLNTDQLMTTNETLGDIHTGILEAERKRSASGRIIKYELQLTANSTAERHFRTHIYIDTS